MGGVLGVLAGGISRCLASQYTGITLRIDCKIVLFRTGKVNRSSGSFASHNARIEPRIPRVVSPATGSPSPSHSILLVRADSAGSASWKKPVMPPRLFEISLPIPCRDSGGALNSDAKIISGRVSFLNMLINLIVNDYAMDFT
jgi:hypothetical protein